MTASPSVPTLAQTICLLALSRGERPPVMAPITRRVLLHRRWIAPSGRAAGAARAARTHEITEAGMRALATSPHLAEAQRKLDAGKQAKPWQ